MEDVQILAFDRRLSCIEKILYDKGLISADDIIGIDVAPTEVSMML